MFVLPQSWAGEARKGFEGSGHRSEGKRQACQGRPRTRLQGRWVALFWSTRSWGPKVVTERKAPAGQHQLSLCTLQAASL